MREDASGKKRASKELPPFGRRLVVDFPRMEIFMRLETKSFTDHYAVDFHKIEIVNGEEGPKETVKTNFSDRDLEPMEILSSYFLYVRLFFKLASANSMIASEVWK